MRVAVHQPNYFPWLGYFAKMAAVDLFIFLDDAQLPQGRSYTKRVLIHGKTEPVWLSAPLRRSGRQKIRDVFFADRDFRRRHRQTLFHTYASAPHRAWAMQLVDQIFDQPTDNLADFNMGAIRLIAGALGLPTRFARSSDMDAEGQSDDRIIALVSKVEGSAYVSGTGGCNYQDPAKFEDAGIELIVRGYYPAPYPHPLGFQPGLSVLDALFCLGPEAQALVRRKTVDSGQHLPRVHNALGI